MAIYSNLSHQQKLSSVEPTQLPSADPIQNQQDSPDNKDNEIMTAEEELRRNIDQQEMELQTVHTLPKENWPYHGSNAT